MLSEIDDEATRLLLRELGAAETARFIRQFTGGYGEYAEERKELFKDLMTLEEVVAEIRMEKKTDT